MSKKQSLTMRSLHYYWLATRNHLGLFVALVASTIGFCGFLTYGNPYVMSLIVDRISADPVAPEAVFDVFGPYIAALIGINVDTLDGNADAISTAKSLLESKGASYQNIYFPSDSAAGDFAGDIMAFPTTYVIDRSGAIVGEAMLGGIDNEDNMAALQKLIDQALANDSAK